MFFLSENYRHPEFRQGLRDQFAVAPGIAAWGLMTGVAMVKSGLSTVEALLMSVLVFAGSAQLAAVPLMSSGAPMWVILATAFCVNLRFVVFSAHMRPYVMHLPLSKRLVCGYLTGDLSYVLFVKRFPKHGGDAAQLRAQQAYLAGNSGLNWFAWVGASVLGVLLSSLVPTSWGLGFAGILALIGEGFATCEIAADARSVRLGPGMVGGEVNRRLAPFGRKIGPDPASIGAAKIGGIAANNASGSGGLNLAGSLNSGGGHVSLTSNSSSAGMLLYGTTDAGSGYVTLNLPNGGTAKDNSTSARMVASGLELLGNNATYQLGAAPLFVGGTGSGITRATQLPFAVRRCPARNSMLNPSTGSLPSRGAAPTSAEMSALAMARCSVRHGFSVSATKYSGCDGRSGVRAKFSIHSSPRTTARAPVVSSAWASGRPLTWVLMTATTTPSLTRTTRATGTSKASPKAMNIVITKDRYASISGAGVILFGAKFAMK